MSQLSPAAALHSQCTYDYRENSLCLPWEQPMSAVGKPMSAMGTAYVCCGNSLCLLWEQPVSAMGTAYVCCGNSLCLL